MSDTTLTLQRLTDIGYLNLRGAASNDDFLTAIAKVTGHALPVLPNTVASASQDLYWLGPDEWLLVGDSARISEILPALTTAIAGTHAALNNLSGAYVTYRLGGETAQLLLAKGCALDLQASAFADGTCAQTGLAKANVILRPLQGGRAYDVIVRRSFSDYVWQWLLRAGREYRIEVA